MREKYEDTFEAGMGAEAIQKLLAEIDLEKLSAELREELEHANGQKRVRLLKRLECVESFLESNQRPEWIHFGTLAAGLGSFPFDDPTYLVPSDSRSSSLWHSEFDILR